jgi:hypothetical protein
MALLQIVILNLILLFFDSTSRAGFIRFDIK